MKKMQKFVLKKLLKFLQSKSLIDDPIIAENERAKAVAVQSQRANPMPNIPEVK